MVLDSLSGVDWRSPAFAPYGRVLPAAEEGWREALTHRSKELGVRNARGMPIEFWAEGLASDVPYEAQIAATGHVPTRDNRHDFFNALVWLVFPRTKARLNALQAEVIARDGIRDRRGGLRDAATVFDESGLLLVTLRLDLIEALRRRDWRGLFVDARSAWAAQVRPIVFGHALLDKLVEPYKSLTAHAMAVPLTAESSIEALDGWLAATLDENFSNQNLLPVPVLGVPGWSKANEDPHFYDDADVFRPLSATRF